MIITNLSFVTQTSPQDFAPATVTQLNRPNQLVNGVLHEKLKTVGDLAIVGVLASKGKNTFERFVGGIGQRTGRTDLQTRANRIKSTIGGGLEIGLGFLVEGPIGAGVVVASQIIDSTIDNVYEQKQRIIDRGEAEFRAESRGAIRNNSRSGL